MLSRKVDYEKLIDKKNAYRQRIYEIRTRKCEINKILDDIWKPNSTNKHPDESPLKLVNEIYTLNLELNKLRDKVDAINLKLQLRVDNASDRVWLSKYSTQ